MCDLFCVLQIHWNGKSDDDDDDDDVSEAIDGKIKSDYMRARDGSFYFPCLSMHTDMRIHALTHASEVARRSLAWHDTIRDSLISHRNNSMHTKGTWKVENYDCLLT